ncbi:MAG: hypothetical protein RL217_1715, partial [Pseudomonadota bacterium]
MFNSKKLLVLALASALAACGGGGKDIGAGKGTGTGTGTGNTNTGGNIVDNTGGSDVSTNTDIKNPLLGSGVGSTFKKGALDIGIGSATLSAGGSTKISVSIVDGDSNNARIISQTFSVTFSSVCSEADPAKAVFSKNDVATSGGEATVTYKATGCEGDDFITVKLRGAEGGKDLQTIIGKIKVAPAEVGALSFVANGSNSLSLQGVAGSLPPNTTVTFKLTDKTNNPIADRPVSFKLSNTNGGVGLALASDRTDTEGNVKAVVLSGKTHNAVTVYATALLLDNTTEISTSSQPISITTGLPSQERVSIAMKPFNPGAWNIDGSEVEVKVTVGDAFGNPVPDGTVINFMVESGVIQPSCPTAGGVCTAKWISGGKRPGQFDATTQVNETQVGFTTVLAYTEGEAGFADVNGNGLFDTGEAFLTFAEPFRDDNGNGTREPLERFIDTDFNGAYSPAPSLYEGAQCSAARKAEGHCARLAHVRVHERFVQSVANAMDMSLYSCGAGTCLPFDYNAGLGAADSILVILRDSNGNLPAAGATLDVTGTDYDMSGDKGVVAPIGIGSLSGLGYTGLPAYGAHYWVHYVVKSTKGPDSKIELVAKSGTKE